jgi:MerR family mercuric resistance operon transcriptional regulator
MDLTIGQLAKKAQINLETIRYYERRGLIKRPDVIYAAIGLMVAVSIWDIFWPANRHCEPRQGS